MVINCAVATCQTTGKDPTSFHRFPSDEQKRKIWIRFCKRKDAFSTKTSRICSMHFEQQYFIRDLRNELLNLPVKRKLSADAVPTIYKEKPKSEREKRLEIKERKRIVEECLRAYSATATNEQNDSTLIEHLTNDSDLVSNHSEALSNQHTSDVLSNQHSKALSAHSDHSESEVISNHPSKTPLSNHSNDVTSLKVQLSQMKRQNALLRKQLRFTRQKCTSLRTKLKNIHSQVKNYSGFFSASQLNKICGKQRTKWGDRDLERALKLRAVSIKAYRLLKEEWKLPLPSPTTLNRWRMQKKSQKLGQSQQNANGDCNNENESLILEENEEELSTVNEAIESVIMRAKSFDSSMQDSLLTEGS